MRSHSEFIITFWRSLLAQLVGFYVGYSAPLQHRLHKHRHRHEDQTVSYCRRASIVVSCERSLRGELVSTQ